MEKSFYTMGIDIGSNFIKKKYFCQPACLQEQQKLIQICFTLFPK